MSNPNKESTFNAEEGAATTQSGGDKESKPSANISDETNSNMAKKSGEEQTKNNSTSENFSPLPVKITPPPAETGRKRRRRKEPLDLEKLAEESKDFDVLDEAKEETTPMIAATGANDTTTNEKHSNTTLPIEYTDELENNILGDLRAHINKYDEESIKGIKSMSYDATVFFSVVFVNQIVEKYVYIDTGLSPEERKQQIISITKYIAGIWYDKGYTDFMSKKVGCSEVFLTIDDKRYKFLSIPIKGAVFNTDAYGLEDSKDQWMHKILFSRFR